MSHNFSRGFSEYDSRDPRPPVPGQEEPRKSEMTDSAQSELHNIMTSSSSSQSSATPPAYERWACSLQHLFADTEGRSLFEQYVESEGKVHKTRFKFYFLCEGLMAIDSTTPVRTLIQGIYSRYIVKLKLPVSKQLKEYIDKILNGEDLQLRPEMFDELKMQVMQIISETTYPSFLQSEMYLQRLQYHRSAIENGPAQAIATSNIITSTSPSLSEASSFLVSRSSTLPTLLEESEGAHPDGSEGGSTSESMRRMPQFSSSSAPRSKVPMSLTKDALIATQRGRLEVRPLGAHGYNAFIHASYAPVSRRDSELASLSSGRTDSDTMSISSRSNDGRPQRHHQYRQNPHERRLMRESVAANKDGQSLPTIPRSLRLEQKVPTQEDFIKLLLPKLEAIEKEQKRMEIFHKNFPKDEELKMDKHKLFNDAISAKLMADDTDNQDILDNHVSRVWNERTPHRSPGNLSPGTNFQRPRRPHENALAMGLAASTQSSMRASKSMPESNINKSNKWGSIYTDSGISLTSSDMTMTKQKDSISLSSSTSSSVSLKPMRSRMMLPECSTSAPLSKISSEEARSRMLPGTSSKRHYQQQPPLPQKNVVPPPLPAKNVSQPAPNAAPGASPVDTYVVYSYCDEDLPYRIRIPGRNTLTLKQCKENMPKKGNYRFFFKTTCDDEENPIIQEEISNDSDVLPLFEGKIMATLKLAN